MLRTIIAEQFQGPQPAVGKLPLIVKLQINFCANQPIAVSIKR